MSSYRIGRTPKGQTELLAVGRKQWKGMVSTALTAIKILKWNKNTWLRIMQGVRTVRDDKKNVKSIYDLKDGRKVVNVQLDCFNAMELNNMIFSRKLRKYGLDQITTKEAHSWLKKHSWSIVLSNSLSGWENVKHGTASTRCSRVQYQTIFSSVLMKNQAYWQLLWHLSVQEKHYRSLTGQD